MNLDPQYISYLQPLTMTQNGPVPMHPELLQVLLLALATAGLASFLRAAWPKRWVHMRPAACPVCMSGWSAFVVLALAYFEAQTTGWGPLAYVLTWLACMGGSALVFRQLYPPEVELPLPE